MFGDRWEELWEKLKALLRFKPKPWAILLTPVISYVVPQILKWLAEGRKVDFLQAMISPDLYWWAGGAVLWLLITVAYYSLLSERNLRNLPEISQKLTKAMGVGLETVEVCIKFLNKTLHETVLNPEQWVNYASVDPSRVSEAIKSLAANLQAWSKRIEDHREEEKNGSPYLTNLWFTYLETYFREEAFDIYRKEIVTNGRNYPFLLISTLSSLLSNLRDDYYLHYYAVTPVNPKDWYNWPHGRIKPRYYCEANFLSLFHRTLQEFLIWDKDRVNGKKLIHTRFILSCDNDVGKVPFGWELDSFDKLTQDLKECWIVPIPVPLDILENSMNLEQHPFGHYLQKYYRYLLEPLGEDQLKLKQIVPLYGNHWGERLKDMPAGILKDESSRRIRSLEDEILSVVANIAKRDKDMGEVLEAAKKSAGETIKASLSNLDKKVSQELGQEVAVWCGGEYKSGVWKYDVQCCGPLDLQKWNFPDFIKRLHQWSLDLASTSKRGEDPIKDVFLACLRYRAAFHNSNLTKFQQLGKVFSEQLHSKPEYSFVARLKNAKNKQEEDESKESPFFIEYWTKEKIEPEFAIFGICKDANCSIGNFDSIEWKLGLATDISYPFETAKIRIIDDESLLNPYVATMKKLLEGVAKKDKRGSLIRKMVELTQQSEVSAT